ncbi:tyrosine-type recombinase/integrase [Pantoea sp. ME81]|uniref:tyrosine-type recombinase/integrase n=1 Tax=Pantoea sp. ME81 TaxID=2743935 RepID=UPI002104091B|nr:tyrosine-type recombinase/integrase [Pantoea sp. ME81]
MTQTVIQKRHTNGCSIPNILKRGNRYSLHFRLPAGRLFRASLSCDSASRAKFISSRLSIFISLVKSARMEPAQLLDIVQKMKRLEQKDIDNYLLSIQIGFYSAAKNIPSTVRSTLRESGSLAHEKRSAFDFGQLLDGTFKNDVEPISTDTVIEELSSQFDLTGMENEIDYLASEYDLLWRHYCDAHLAFMENRNSDYRQIVSSMRPDREYSSIPADKPHKPSKPVITLSQAWEGFVRFKSDWKPQIRQGNEKYFEVIKAVLGSDTSVTDITRRDIKNLLEVVEGLPRQNKKPYNKMTIQQCLDLDEIPDDDLISSKTVRDYLKLCQGLFSTYLTMEIGALDTAPTDKVRYEAQSKSYGNYSRTEMRRLVEHFTTLEDWKKWVFLLLSYTGARRAEISKLTVSDIRFDDDSQWHYIMIEDSKTDAGTRQVPLAPRLVEMGFLAYVKGKAAGEKLFPEITNSTQLTRIFHVIRETLDIDYMDDYKSRRIVHSLRHTFITEVQKTNNTQLVQQVVGHEHSNIGQTQRYTHRFTVSDLLPVVKCFDWFK